MSGRSEKTIEIPLTKGKFSTIDYADLRRVMGYLWRARKCGKTWYAQSTRKLRNGKRQTIGMQSLILPAPYGCVTDHINRNGLDNRRANLRHATKSQNQFNAAPSAGSSSFKGVSWNRKYKRWHVRIGVNRSHLWAGSFTDEIDAALAYDHAALEHHGEFAFLNFPFGDPRACDGAAQ